MPKDDAETHPHAEPIPPAPAPTPESAPVAVVAPIPEVAPAPAPTAPPEPMTTEQRLRAFEDRTLGHDVPRIDGKIERGIGSRFSSMSDEDKAEHFALERMIVAEADLMKAEAALAAAQVGYDEAKKNAAG